MNPDECIHIIYDLRASDNVECFVCCTKDMSDAYIPESVLVYLDCMQRERKESVIYLDGVNAKSGVASSVAGKESDSGVEQERAEIKYEPVSEAESSTVKHESVSRIDSSSKKHESVSGVEPSPEPAEPVSAQPEVEVIPVSNVEVVSEEEDAKDSIRSLLSSLG